MRIKRVIAGALAGTALLAPAARAEPGEPLVVTRMADPDPNFIPTSSGRGTLVLDNDSNGAEDLRIDEAMQSFGKAIGEAAMIAQQRIAQRCREGQQDAVTPEQRFAWAANCRYSRH